MNNPPSAERILSILAELYADQMGVEIKYKIVDKEDEKDAVSV